MEWRKRLSDVTARNRKSFRSRFRFGSRSAKVSEFSNPMISRMLSRRSRDAYVEIEKGMIDIELALTPTAPDTAAVSALVSKVMDSYNTILAQITKEARAAK
jgi:hypothetical protein